MKKGGGGEKKGGETLKGVEMFFIWGKKIRKKNPWFSPLEGVKKFLGFFLQKKIFGVQRKKKKKCRSPGEKRGFFFFFK